MDSPWASGENYVSRISISTPLLRSSEIFSLSSAQLQIASLEVGFTHEACNLRNLTAMMVGSLAFKASRLALTESFSALGWMGNSITATSLRGLAWMSATAIEVSAFRGTGHLLSNSPAHESIFNPQSFMTSYIDFITLKTGALFHTQSLGLRRFIQDGAVVAGHHIGHALGYTTEPSGSLSEQFLHAEAMNASMEMGVGLAGAITGHRIHSFERNLEARLERTSIAPSRQASRSVFNPAMNAQREALPITRSAFLPNDANALLEYLEVDAAVADLQTVTNRPSSRSHLENSRKYILEAAARVAHAGEEPREETERLVALVLGAGNSSEIPVVELVRQHKFRVTLVDISEGGLKTSLEALPADVRPFVRGVVADLTDGVLFEIARKMRTATDQRNQSLVGRVPVLSELLRAFEDLKDCSLSRNWSELVGEPRADLVVSSMIANQAFCTLNNRMVEIIEAIILDFTNTVITRSRQDPAFLESLRTNPAFAPQMMALNTQMASFQSFLCIGGLRLFVNEMLRFLREGSVVYSSIDLNQQIIKPGTGAVESFSRLSSSVGSTHRRLRDIFPTGMRIVSEQEWQWDVDRTDERAESARIYGPTPRLVVWRSIQALTLMPETVRKNAPAATASEGVAAASEPTSIEALQQNIQTDLRSETHYRRGGDTLKAGLESPDAETSLKYVEVFRRLSLVVPDRLPRDCLLSAAALLQRAPSIELVNALKIAQRPMVNLLGAAQKAIVAAHLTLAKNKFPDAAVQRNLSALLGALKADPSRVEDAIRNIRAGNLAGMRGAVRLERLAEVVTGAGIGLLSFWGLTTYERLHHAGMHPALPTALSLFTGLATMVGVHYWIAKKDASRIRITETEVKRPSPAVISERSPKTVNEPAFIDWISLPTPEFLAGKIRDAIQAAPDENCPEPEYIQSVLVQMQAQVSWRNGTLPWPAEFASDGKRDGLRLPYKPQTRLAMINAFASQVMTLPLGNLSLLLHVFADTRDHFVTGDVSEGTMMLREGVRGFPEFVQPALFSLRALFATRLLREYQNNPQVMKDRLYRDLVFWLFQAKVKVGSEYESITDPRNPSHELQEVAIYALQRIARDPTEVTPLNEFRLLDEFREYQRGVEVQN